MKEKKAEITEEDEGYLGVVGAEIDKQVEELKSLRGKKL